MTRNLQDILASRPFIEFQVQVPKWIGDQATAWPVEVLNQIDQAERIFRSRECAIAVSAVIHACVFDEVDGSWLCIRGLSFTRLIDIEQAINSSACPPAEREGGPAVSPPESGRAAASCFANLSSEARRAKGEATQDRSLERARAE